jgi:hypothetical protein
MAAVSLRLPGGVKAVNGRIRLMGRGQRNWSQIPEMSVDAAGCTG